jgi:hypothetical protein
MIHPARDLQRRPEGWAYDLLLYGNEQILRASDNATLVAFAALAFQQVRGKNETHHNVACGFLLVSVLMCAVIHLTMGHVYYGLAKRLIREQDQSRVRQVTDRVCLWVAWVAGVVQMLSLVAGLLLLVPDQVPEALRGYFPAAPAPAPSTPPPG